ncbi:MAG TPA: hypothetical protein VJ824_06775 [Bacillota bacterium]|nr:hypothetical protein [Bacillota bacterium]
MYHADDFVQILESNDSSLVYATLRKVILMDEQLDDQARVQKLIQLMHSYSKVNNHSDLA